MRGGLPTGSASWLSGFAVVCAIVLASCGGQSASASPTAAPDEPPPLAVVTDDSSPTVVPVPTAEPSPTSTATPVPSTTPAPTATPVPAPTETHTPVATGTATPAPTETPTSVATEAPTETPTLVPTETPTAVPTETPTPTATPTETPTPKPTATPTPTAREIAAGQLSELLSWFDDPPDGTHSAAAEEIVSIWLLDVELGEAVVELDWVANSIGDSEADFLGWLAGFADRNPVLSHHVLRLPWLSNDVTADELRALWRLVSVASSDFELALRVLSLPWYTDGVSDSERRLLGEIWPLNRNTLELVGAFAALSWYADGLTNQEERGLFHTLRLIASRDPGLARMLASYEWLMDDVREGEWGTLYTLNKLASHDLELARTVADQTWFADKAYVDKWRVLTNLDEIASRDLELAKTVADISSSRDDGYLLPSLAGIANRDDDKFAQLTAQRWFADGIDDEEAALFIALEDAAGDARNLFLSLVRNRHTQSRTVSFPLSGEVRFWAFQAIPFPRNKDVVGMMEEAVRAGESLFGTPFPMKDVVVVLQPVGGATRGYGGQFRGDHIRLVMYDFSDVNRGVIYHEIAHYYLTGAVGPTWLVEGGAEFAVAYVRDWIGVDSLEVRLPTARKLVRDNCHNQGVRNISRLLELYPEKPDSLFLCHYSMGAYFLHNLFDLMGQDAMSAAFRDLLLLHKSTGTWLTEERIYQTFKANVPRGKEEQFNDAYRLWHGGDFVDP